MSQPDHAQTIAAAAAQAQRRAADPSRSVWVNASAGTGKTKVLTERVLRLLLPRPSGEPASAPHKILCLTYTRAAAGEMAERLLARVTQWTTMNEPALVDDLTKLQGTTPTPLQLQAARSLFTRLADGPDFVRLMTIHAFCQSVLARFPLEAGVPPHFTLIEETEAQELLADARAQLWVQSNHQPDLAAALDHLSTERSDDSLGDLLDDLLADRRSLQVALATHQGEKRLAALRAMLHLPTTGDLDAWLDDNITHPSQVLLDDLAVLANGLATGVTREKTLADKIYSWLGQPIDQRRDTLDTLISAFFDGNGVPYKDGAHQGARKKDPDLAALYQRCGEAVGAIKQSQSLVHLYHHNHALLTVAEAVLVAYDARKRTRAVLDFDDLIRYCGRLLQTDPTLPSWVRYKLDGGIDHILVDEAQDTNPEQWQLIAALTQDFGVTDTNTPAGRTLFVVGDQKQSIYRFQGADPDRFEQVALSFGPNKVMPLHLDRVPLHTSFRSTAAVLQTVDQVFQDPDLYGDLRLEAPPHHGVHRISQAGRVTLWPLVTTPKAEPIAPWEPPTTIKPLQDSIAILARQLAKTIAAWCQDATVLSSTQQPIQPQDILILVRKRRPWMPLLAAALRQENVPVAGLDRQIITDHLAIKDLLAVARFALQPEDDLNLACLLKSPIFDLDESALIDLAATRPHSLWSAVQQAPAHHATAVLLSQWTQQHDRHLPYQFLAMVLATTTPAGVTIRDALVARLGLEADAILTELLTLSQKAQATGQTLAQFLYALDHHPPEIKRESSGTINAVRLMTVHGAKGLEAPVVILPDTLITHHDTSEPTIFKTDDTGAPLPLWVPRKRDRSPALHDVAERARLADRAEYARLLYVAMTRAKDHLLIAGAVRGAEPDPYSWYDHIKRALIERGATQTPGPWPEPTLQFDDGETPAASLAAATPTTKSDQSLPWVADSQALIDPANLAAETGSFMHHLDRLNPSNADDAPSPLAARDDPRRFLRGQLIHKLLQILPNLPPHQRDQAAKDFLANRAGELEVGAADEIAASVRAVLDHPDFAPLFGPGSYAELGVAGYTADGRLVSGQIDRLLITPGDIWIIDYKTNRPPPTSPDQVPAAYRQQVALYAALLQDIYPNRPVHSALLWTEGPTLMPLEPTKRLEKS